MISDLLDKCVKWYRPEPGVDATNSEYLGDDQLVCRSVPVSIQPASAKQIEFYLAFRSMEVTHSIFTETGGFERNDVLTYDGRRFTVVGVRDLIERGRVFVLDCLEYRGANKRQ